MPAPRSRSRFVGASASSGARGPPDAGPGRLATGAFCDRASMGSGPRGKWRARCVPSLGVCAHFPSFTAAMCRRV
eukprot:11218607-Lingulodinium_polyedra.AAC.1